MTSSDDDFGSRGQRTPFLMPGLWMAAIFGLLLWVASGPWRDPPPSPSPLYGCYKTPGGPDILIDKSAVTVFQSPPIKVKSSLKYIKGWTFEIERWLNFSRTERGTIQIEKGPPYGEYLLISSEGEAPSTISRFDLIDHGSGQSIIYKRSGPTCSG